MPVSAEFDNSVINAFKDVATVTRSGERIESKIEGVTNAREI
jgi:hypothetical protein